MANSTHNGTTRRDGVDAFRSRALYTRDESGDWNDRNRENGLYWPTGAIRTGKGDGDTTLSTAQHWPIQMNYDYYYAWQVGGALPYFTGAHVQKGHSFGSLSSGLLRSVAPQIKRGALALGKRALTTGAQIVRDAVADQNIKKATKRRATAAGGAQMNSILATPAQANVYNELHPVVEPVLPNDDDNDRMYFRRRAFVHR